MVGGKYRIVRPIGVGAMGSVYAAQHEHLGSPAALKFLLPRLSKVPNITQRFLREGRIAASLRSPHLTHVRDVDQLEGGVPYLVMELLTGQPLDEWLARQVPLDPSRAVEFASQILSGLQVAHAAGVVHRDLKPANTFVTEADGGPVLKLLDFGIAKVRATREYQALTRPGTVLGTPEYMAPEQALSADEASVQSDLYSVGVMLYEMLSGRLPIVGKTPAEVAAKVAAGEVPPLDQRVAGIDPALAGLVHRAMDVDPTQRPPSAEALRRALGAFVANASPAAGSPSSAVRGRPGTARFSSPPTPGRAPSTTAASSTPPEAKPSAGDAAGASDAPRALAPTADMPGVARPRQSRPRRSKRHLWVIAACALLLSVGVASALGLYSGRFRQLPPPPPMPTPQAG